MSGPANALIQPAGLASDALLAAQIASRYDRLCRRAIASMQIDLAGMTVLTEAATGPFAVTPVIAALAGARVRAIGKDNRWGTAEQAFATVDALARRSGVADAITFHADPPAAVAADCDIVTNLGAVRPIDARLAARLPPNACVSLMWEPWEFRPGEVDLTALHENQVALIATNEHHEEVCTFAYLGVTVARMLFEIGIEIVGSRLLVIGSDPFGAETSQWLSAAGASVLRKPDGSDQLDAVIVVEHRDRRPVIDDRMHAAIRLWAANGTPVVRLCGHIDEALLASERIAVFPATPLAPGTMSVTTAFAGPRPVIDLHAAGLRAAADVVSALRDGAGIEDAIGFAVAGGFGLPVRSSLLGEAQ